MKKKILNISERAIIALHAAMMLTGSKIPLRAGEIAKKFGFSPHHLSKIMQELCRAGFVKATRGPKGGFVLAKKPSEIKLADIYEEIEGKFNPDICLINSQKCLRGGCILGNLATRVNREFKKMLNKTLARTERDSKSKL